MPCLRNPLIVVAFSLALSALFGRAHAQSAGNEPGGYREAVEMGTDEFNRGNYAEARSLFEKAHALSPNARSLRGLGLAEFELRNYPRAIDYLERALEEDIKPLSGEVRESTQTLLHRAQGFIGRVQVEVEPSSSTVLVNGEPVENIEAELVLSVGDHVLEFSATGYATQRRTLRVIGRSSQKLTVELQSLASTGAALASASERPPAAVPVYRRWWLWTSIAVVAVGAGVAAVLITQQREPKRSEFYDTPNTPNGAGFVISAREVR